MTDIVYHGSSEPDLENIDANWPPPGGLGFGVYVSYNKNVAEFYSKGYLYKLRLFVNQDDIFVIDSADYENFAFVPGFEETSILIGENVPPFSFNLDGRWVTVSNDEEITDQIRWKWFKESISPKTLNYMLSYALKSYISAIDSSCYIGSVEDFVEDLDEHMDWDVTNMEDEEDQDEYLEQLQLEATRILEPIEEDARAAAEERYGYVVDLMGIGAEVKHAGYRALYVDGIRGGFPDSELLVFDPDDLEILEELPLSKPARRIRSFK